LISTVPAREYPAGDAGRASLRRGRAGNDL